MARKRTGPAKVVKVVSAAEIAANPGKYRISGKVARPVAAETRTKGILGGPVDDMVYVVSDSEISSGEYRIEGGSAQVVVDSVLVPSRKIGDTRNVVPVYVVAGNLAQSYTEKVLSYSPIAYWPLGETSGTNADNAEGTAALDGTFARNITTMTTGAGIGDGNTAPLFDGTSDFCNIYTALLATAFNGTEGTASVWCKVSGSGDWTDGSFRAAWRIDSVNDDQLIIRKNTTSNQVQFIRVNGGADIITKTAVSDLGWFNLVLTWSESADQLKAYYNGAKEGATISGIGLWIGAASSTKTNIGSAGTGPAEPWKGYLAHVALWDTALSPATIADLATI